MLQPLPSLQNIDDSKSIQFKSAQDHLQLELSNGSIATMSQSLDNALGHGIKLGAVTELCGLPGSGRSQLCLQLCISVQIPIKLGGIEGETIYIDTASNFSTTRLKQMSVACRKHLNQVSKTDTLEIDWESRVMEGIHVVEAFGIIQFSAAINLLDDFVKNNPKIKLIVIDNIAFPFKSDCSEIDRTGVLYRTIAKLRRIASQKNIAILITNEMSTRIGSGVVGALGDAWAHCTGVRLIMSPPHVIVSHSSEIPESIAKIQISEDGIRDYVECV